MLQTEHVNKGTTVKADLSFFGFSDYRHALALDHVLYRLLNFRFRSKRQSLLQFTWYNEWREDAWTSFNRLKNVNEHQT
jgi:hypothetical protein